MSLAEEEKKGMLLCLAVWGNVVVGVVEGRGCWLILQPRLERPLNSSSSGSTAVCVQQWRLLSYCSGVVQVQQ